MPSFPYFGSPFSPYRRYNYNPYIVNNKSFDVHQSNSTSADNEKVSVEDIPPKSNDSRDNIKDDSYLFDLFGIKLYFDDILLVCLIFFLYNEGVKDDGLFFALILLLLT